MVHVIDLGFFRHPTVLAVERHRNFGFQKPLPLILPLLRNPHNAFSVSKHMWYCKPWDVVIDTAFGTIAYSVSRSRHGKHANCPVNGRFWDR